jgi:hypothetical protein
MLQRQNAVKTKCYKDKMLQRQNDTKTNTEALLKQTHTQTFLKTRFSTFWAPRLKLNL